MGSPTEYTSVKLTVIATAVVVSSGVGAVCCLIHWLKGKKTNKKEHASELLFFPDDRPTCKALYTERQGCHNPQCRFSHDENSSFNKLMKHLTSARQSIDLCIFCFTSPELSDIIITMHRRGLRVRLITDNEQVDASNSQVGKFRAEGKVCHIDLSVLLSQVFFNLQKYNTMMVQV